DREPEVQRRGTDPALRGPEPGQRRPGNREPMSTVNQAAGPAQLMAAAAAGMPYPEFRALLERLVAEGRTTGPDQGPEMVAYTKLNLARTVRSEKTVALLPELREALAKAPPMTWLVLTEPWCGDSSQVMPVVARMADAAPQLRLRIVL